MTSCRILTVVCADSHSRTISGSVLGTFSTARGLPHLLHCNYSGVLPVSLKGQWLWLYIKYAYEGNNFSVNLIDGFVCHFEIGLSSNIFQKRRFIIPNRCCLSSHTVLMWYLDSTDQGSVFSSHYGRECNLQYLGNQRMFVTISAVYLGYQ